jgi:hypothetical protein
MKKFLVLIVAIGIVTFAYTQDKTNEQGKKIDELIQKLGDNDWKTREKAEKALQEIGEPALPKLKKALRDKDPERSFRAERLVEQIEKNLKRDNKLDSKDSSGVVSIKKIKGRIIVTETKIKDGEPRTKTYRAKDEEEFKRKYPSIAKKYGIGEKKEVQQGVQNALEEVQKMQKQIEEDMDKLDEEGRRALERLFEFEIVPADKLPSDKREKENKEEDRKDIKNESGLSVRPADETLRKQLGFAEDEGVVVEDVEKGTVGDALGLKKHDIILSVNNENVSNVWEFRLKMNQAIEKKGAIILRIKREGKDSILSLNLHK